MAGFLLPPKPLCDELVDAYFKWVAPVVPIINKSRFMRLSTLVKGHSRRGCRAIRIHKLLVSADSRSCQQNPPKPLCDELVDAYFKWVAPVVPIINKSRFMRHYRIKRFSTLIKGHSRRGCRAIRIHKLLVSADSRSCQLCDELVDAYFKWVAPVVPIINKSRFMRHYRDPKNPSS
jgi:hypothetical protein